MPVEKWSDTTVLAHLGDDPQFSEDVECAMGLCPPCVSAVLDFSAVHYVNSSNIADLLRFRRLMQDRNGKLILCRVGKTIWSTFLVTGLDKVFQFSDDVMTALATIQLKEPNAGSAAGEPESDQ
jgi:anti-anti-sigma factor